MLTIRQGLKLSAIIDKLDIKITNAKASQEEVGADLMLQVISKAHKAEKEIISFVAEMKKVTSDEAAEIDLIEFMKEMFADSNVAAFFKSAVGSDARE